GSLTISPISLVAHTCSFCTGFSGTTSPAITTTGATALVAACSSATSPAPAPTDFNSNSWRSSILNTTNSGIPETVSWYVVASPTVGSGHTFTISSGENCVFLALNGTKTSGTI